MSNRRPRAILELGAHMGIRQRSMLIAVMVVLVALLAGGTGLVYLLQTNLERTSESSAAQRAAEVSGQILSSGVREATTTLAEESRSGQFVQILDASGAVVGASNRLVSVDPMSPQRPHPGMTTSIDIDIDDLGEAGDWKVVSQGVATDATTTYVVQVAIAIRVQRETVQTVAVFLLAATPVLLIGVALAVWFLVGRALLSVERIRGEVASIDAHGLAQRVQVPPTRDEVAALAVTMNAMLDKLEVSYRAQRAFVSDASHELRSPLTTLTTAAELASTGDEPTRTRLLSTITLELTRVRGLVENLMTLARVDSDDLVTKHVDVDLDDVVDVEVRRLRSTSRHEIIVRIDPARVAGDDQRLAQAVRNLVDNAERHAQNAIRLTLTSGEVTAILWVDNDGAAIDAADRERVFERFVRLDESRSRDAGGSGLGLSISRSTVESHGGALTVTDAPDGWCRFQVSLPLAVSGAPIPRN